MKTRTLLLTFFFVFFAVLLILMFFLSRAKTNYLGRASGSDYSLANSYVFASPLSVKSVSEKARVTVFLLNNDSHGVVGKKIDLVSNPRGVNFAAVQGETDKMGQAIYDLTSPIPGKFIITASVDGIVFPQTVTIVFQ